MSHEDLHALVQELKSEIAALHADDEEARRRLQGLVDDLERRLDEEEVVEHEALMDSVRETIERFEVEHPRATGILNNIMVMLGNLGI